MISYVENKLWNNLEVTKPKTLWVAEVLLNIPHELITKYRRALPSLIYRVFFSLGEHENSYVTSFNGARADLIAYIIPTTDDDARIIRIDTEPIGDPSYWLLSHVLGFTDMELSVLCSIPVDQLHNPGRDLIPVLKQSYNILRKIKLKDPLLHHYHRRRHIMIRYFLDAVYHEI